jgi:pilus assembly protein Flp/PilA
LVPTFLIVEFTWMKGRHGIDGRRRDSKRGPSVMSRLLVGFGKDQSGATAIEYAIIAAGISIIIVVAVNSIGTSLNSTFSGVSSAFVGGGS